MGQIHMGRANPFRALVADLTADEFLLLGEAADEFLLLGEAVDERRCRDEVGVGTLAEAAEAYRAEPKCPRRLEGRLHRRRRPEMALPLLRQENHLSHGPVLKRCRKPPPVWVPLIRLMRHNVPVKCAAELCGVTRKTAFEWRHRVFATVSGYQDQIVLRDTVWVDEIYINDTDLSKGYGQARKRGLSLQKLSICAPSTSTRTRSRSSAATGSLARRA